MAERVTDPHLAAVEFLNRTSDESVGYALLTIRFADAPGGGHYVDLDVLARPNHWTKETTRTGSRTAAPERVEFLTAVHSLIQDRLERAGWYQVTLHLDRPRINLQLPDDHPLKGRGYYTLRAAPTSFRFRHVATGFDTFEESQRFVAGLRAQYGESMAAALPADTVIEWGITGRGNDATTSGGGAPKWWLHRCARGGRRGLGRRGRLGLARRARGSLGGPTTQTVKQSAIQ